MSKSTTGHESGPGGPRPSASRQARNSYQAEVMRQRRADPAVREKERKAERALDAARRRLADAHQEEMLVLVQEERRKRGLPPLIPKSKQREHTKAVRERRDEAKDLFVPADPSVQRKCRHINIKKLPYGTFCTDCKLRLR